MVRLGLASSIYLLKAGESKYFPETNSPDIFSVVECERNFAKIHHGNSRSGRTKFERVERHQLDSIIYLPPANYFFRTMTPCLALTNPSESNIPIKPLDFLER
jgi:hypothetical protein